jgi:hypothetical protein
MDTVRVPTLDWPQDLFCDAADSDTVEAQENPFLEAGDFAKMHEPIRQPAAVPSLEYALAA